MNVPFVNAQAMHDRSPATFEVPSPIELNDVRVGDFVKVCAASERFWVQVTKVVPGGYSGVVDNDLIHTAAHGYSDGDAVSVDHCHVYSILMGDQS